MSKNAAATYVCATDFDDPVPYPYINPQNILLQKLMCNLTKQNVPAYTNYS